MLRNAFYQLVFSVQALKFSVSCSRNRGLYGPVSLCQINSMAKNRDAYFKAYYQANKEKYAARGKAWRAANPDKALALDRKWKAKNHSKIVKYRKRTKEKRNAWQREYEATRRDPVKRRAHRRKWQSENVEKYLAIKKAWREKHGARYTAMRRSLKSKATPKWLTLTDLSEIEAIYLKASELNLDVDHIVPIKGKTVCGLHVPWNLQLLTPNDNKAKSNRLPPEHKCIAAISIAA